MADIRLTDAERLKLMVAYDDWVEHEHGDDSLWGDTVAGLVTAALSAVPRLALASPMVGEVVEKAWREGWASWGHAAGGFPLSSAARTWDDEGWEYSRAKAALTGEEATGGDD